MLSLEQLQLAVVHILCLSLVRSRFRRSLPFNAFPQLNSFAYAIMQCPLANQRSALGRQARHAPLHPSVALPRVNGKVQRAGII